MTPVNHCLPGYRLAMEGDFAGAVPHYRAMFERDPGNPVGRLFMVWVLLAAGQDKEARDIGRGFEPPTHESAAAWISGLFTGVSDPARLPPFVDELAGASLMYARLLAQAYAAAGDTERSLFWWERAVDQGLATYPYLAEHDPHFRALPEGEKKREILKKVLARWRVHGEAAHP
jgi:hypothetical protein